MGKGFKCRRVRECRGNMLILALSVVGVIVFLFGLFGLKFISIMGSAHEQRTAIEAAALASADALSRIVIEDPELGFVGLADGPPVGSATTAGDNYYLPVSGINSLIGRTRLDMIIAQALKDDTIKQLALSDYARVMRVKDALLFVLKDAARPGGVAKDADGKSINLYNIAVSAYKDNALRMSGKGSALDEPSLKLTLGTVIGIASNCRAPYPDSFRSASDDSFQDGFYKSSVNFPFEQKDFVFCASGDHSTLIDTEKFRTSVPGLPYFIPSVIRCEADHILVNNGQENKLHAAACAVAGASNQEMAHSGYLCFNFSAGRIVKYDSPRDIIWSKEIGHSPADLLQTAVGGDYPPSRLEDTTVDGGSTHPLMENIMKRALYDWLKRGGSRLNIQSLLDSIDNNFPVGPSANRPQVVRYDINSAGTVDASVVETGSRYILPVSNAQIFARTEFAINDSATGKFYDLFVRDYCYKHGRSSADGGLHAGEPILVNDFMGPPAKPDEPTGVYNKALDQDPMLAVSFPNAPGGKRETYIKPGVVVEYKLRIR